MKSSIHNQRGAVIVIFALSLVVLIGFVAIGTEIGRWYHVRAELSKAVDAAALAGAANISNTTINVEALARDFGMENFQPGYLGTPSTGEQSVSFAANIQEGGRISVTGRTTSVGILSKLFGVEYVPTRAEGMAQKNKVEIILVLDRSGSMSGNPLSSLKAAARAFLGYYEDTQDEDRIGLVTFATSVSLRSPDTNFFAPITNTINALVATGATNAEDALAQAGAAFTDQTGVPASNRIQQFIVFFTDGRPTAFRSTFRRDRADYDAVVCSTGNCDSNSDTMYDQMGYTDRESWYGANTLPPGPTGDGNATAMPNRTVCTYLDKKKVVYYLNTRWGSFSAYPVPNYGAVQYPNYCDLNNVHDSGDNRRPLNGQNGYICRTASQMAIDHANELKNATHLGINGVQIYTIGLGNNINANLLSTISSGQGYAYVAPTSSELEAIFRRIAREIKLRLVQ